MSERSNAEVVSGEVSLWVGEFLEELRKGRICVHPAGTLWGLTFDSRKEDAWKRIWEIKRRHSEHKLLFLAQNYKAVLRYWQPLPAKWNTILRRMWPAHISVIWYKKEGASGPFFRPLEKWKTIGFRVPSYESESWFEEVLKKHPHPLPTTSINVSGDPSVVLSEEVKNFAEKYDIYYPEKLFSWFPQSSLGEASSVIRVRSSGHYGVERYGCYSCNELRALLGLS